MSPVVIVLGILGIIVVTHIITKYATRGAITIALLMAYSKYNVRSC